MAEDRDMRTRLLLLAGAALLLVACGSDAKTTSSGSSSSSTSSSATSTTTNATTTTSGGTTTVRVYFLRDEKVGPAGRTVAKTGAPAKAAMEELLKGPSASDDAAGLQTVIPAGTKLNDVTIEEGVATVDMSSSFGSGGGSLSIQGRVAQVVYTLTQFPTVNGVSFELDGVAVTALGGEGLVLDHPQTRADWEGFTPAILLESPLPGDAITSPFHVTGTANTFEATLRIRLTSPDGTVLADGFATATSGSGTRGTFDETLTFTTTAHGAATLRLFESSAKDGSEINVVEIPVQV
jgi:spore germination protein GerM